MRLIVLDEEPSSCVELYTDDDVAGCCREYADCVTRLDQIARTDHVARWITASMGHLEWFAELLLQLEWEHRWRFRLKVPRPLRVVSLRLATLPDIGFELPPMPRSWRATGDLIDESRRRYRRRAYIGRYTNRPVPKFVLPPAPILRAA